MKKALIIIVALAFLVRIATFTAIYVQNGPTGFMLSDSWGFYQTAVNLLDGHGFSQSAEAPFVPGSRFPPLMPIFLAASLAVAGSIIPFILIQIALSAITPLIVWHIARTLTNYKAVWYGAAILTAFEPLSVYLSTIVLTDALSVFLLLLGVLYLIRFAENQHNWKTAGLSGLFMGLSSLTRPEAFYISIVCILLIAIWRAYQIFKNSWRPERRRLVASGAFVFIFIFTVSPWLIRNYVQFNTLSIATTGVRNVYSSISPSILSLKTGKPHHEVTEKLRADFSEKYDVAPERITTDPSLGPLLVKEGVSIIKNNIGTAVFMYTLTLSSFFTQDLYLTYLRYYDVVPNFTIDFSPTVVMATEGPIAVWNRAVDLMGPYILIPAIGRLFWILMSTLLFVGIGFVLFRKEKIKIAGLIIAGVILIYAAGSSTVGFSDHGRHRYRVNPLIFTMASYGAFEIFSRLKARKNRITS